MSQSGGRSAGGGAQRGPGQLIRICQTDQVSNHHQRCFQLAQYYQPRGEIRDYKRDKADSID